MKYSDPLFDRYASIEMKHIFSDNNRYQTWRKIWYALAKAQQELGLEITTQQLQEMHDNISNIDFERVSELEKDLKHDVMAHLHAFAEVAPLAKPIIHLGATSESIKDNTDCILTKEALLLVKSKLTNLIEVMSNFALQYKDVATLGFTHYQVAQPTTVGKRACLWIQSLHEDLQDLNYFLQKFKLRGIKGTTGTMASFKELFGCYETSKKLDQKVTNFLGFKDSFSVTGQTYDRKQDSFLFNLLSQLGISAHKITNDIRLLQNLKEIEEGFSKNQIGSSAMPYKKNPIKSERVSSLAKYLIGLPTGANIMSATQWLERTLDDSAIRRIIIPSGFLAIDAILDLLTDIFTNLQVNKKVINKNINVELPFLATENILMEAVKNGGDRQDLHEIIRQYSIEIKKQIIEEGKNNNLLDKIINDNRFKISKDVIDQISDINNFTGFASQQVTDFLISLNKIKN